MHHYIYAQINHDGICVGISMLSAEVNSPDLIKLDNPDESLIGQQYDGQNWLIITPDVTPPPERIVSQIFFRRLWQADERMLLDHVMQVAPESVPLKAKLLISTMMADIKATGDGINAYDADIVTGVALVSLCQLINAGRAAQILSTLRECSLEDAQALIEAAQVELLPLLEGV